jgi:two-component system KDP operon response regulator KdpE
LTARLRTALRHAPEAGLPVEPILASGDLMIDLDKRLVKRRGEVVHLTPNEWELLSRLAKNPGKLVTQAQLLKEVWGPAGGDNAHYLRTFMHQLRKKLEDDPAQPKWLLTEPGVGYRLRMEP